jgi:hypothetical protein
MWHAAPHFCTSARKPSPLSLAYIAQPNFQAGRTPAFDPPLLLPQMIFSSPRLYLAAGVTTMRTTGSVEPYADLNLRDRIDAGMLPGPHIDVTAPYLEGKNSDFIQMHELGSPSEAEQFVEYWAGAGATSFKAYMHITRAELKAAIAAAHRRGISEKLNTPKLCSKTESDTTLRNCSAQLPAGTGSTRPRIVAQEILRKADVRVCLLRVAEFQPSLYARGATD